MKQHERTHKNSPASQSDDSKKSKAAITKASVAERSHKRDASVSDTKSITTNGRRDSIHSPLSEMASMDIAHSMTTPISTHEESVIYGDPTVVPNTSVPEPIIPDYPPLDEATLGQINQRPMPSFPRTFSDLDTLAMAAAYDPYHNVQQL